MGSNCNLWKCFEPKENQNIATENGNMELAHCARRETHLDQCILWSSSQTRLHFWKNFPALVHYTPTSSSPLKPLFHNTLEEKLPLIPQVAFPFKTLFHIIISPSFFFFTSNYLYKSLFNAFSFAFVFLKDLLFI